jgi:hypothetical protein
LCPEKTNIVTVRKTVQFSLRYKSNDGKKIIPVFSRRERERELNIVPNKYSSGSYPELISTETY